MRITSPGLTNSGTFTVAPVSSFAGFVAPVAVSPLKPGSVSSTLSSTCAGRSAPIAVASWNWTLIFIPSFRKSAGSPMTSRQREVLVRLAVHEVVAVVVVVEHLHLAVVDRRALELLAGAERTFDGRAALHVLEPRAHEGRALARLDVKELDDGP